MAKLTVYGTPISTYVRTVRLLLETAGADYDLVSVNFLKGETNSAEYRVKNPFGKVPTIDLDGQVIYETAAISEYLDTVVCNHQFTPSDPLLKARMRQIMAIVDSYLYPSAISTIVIQRLIVPSQGGTTDEEKVQKAVAPAKTAIEAIEALTVGDPYLLGSEVSLADFYLIPIFVYLSKTPEFDAILSEAPKLQTWWQQSSQLDSVKKVCA
jgi:glutathione S-transferase